MEENVVGIRDLKQNASEVMARVKKGESVLVTDRGRPVGRIVPLSASSLDELVEAGLATAPTASLDEFLASVPRGEPSGIPSQAILDEIREDRL
jgi:prevent-host-death family protein